MCLADFTNEEFENAYKIIRDGLTASCTVSHDKTAIILGGQPGAGKSTFYRMREDLDNYIAINGDEFRRFHPLYGKIINTDPENYIEHTKAFSSKVVETLIEDLSNCGFNMIIEGTLRSHEVPIRTSEQLKNKGYQTDLVVIACDAEKSWQSTIERAEKQKENGLSPRLVSIDAYNHTVQQIPESLSEIEKRKCFDSITIMKRDGLMLYTSELGNEKASDILRKKINLEKWNEKYPEYKQSFERIKKTILKTYGKDNTMKR